MKRYLIVLMVISGMVFYVSCGDGTNEQKTESAEMSPSNIENMMVGKWEGTTAGKELMMILNENGTFTLASGPIKIEGTFFIDATADPLEIDLIPADSLMLAPLLGIMRIHDNDKIEIRAVQNERPEEFMGPDDPDTIIFTRASNKESEEISVISEDKSALI